MNVGLPMVAMVLFCVVFVGMYVWMRRPNFGESVKPTVRIRSTSIKTLSTSKDDHRVKKVGS